MKFEAMKQKPVDYTLRVCAYRAGIESIDLPLDRTDKHIQHAALRAIAEHLGPETVREVLGDNARSWTVSDGAAALAEQATIDAIRAAGYDPDETGAAEVIRHQHELRHRTCDERDEAKEQRDAARQAQRDAVSESQRLLERAKRAERERNTARAQLREWRETVGPILDAAEPDSDGVVDSQRIREEVCIRRHSLRRLLSATPDDPRSPNARAAEDEIDRIASEQQGPVEPMVLAGECERLRKRVEKAERERDEAREDWSREAGASGSRWMQMLRAEGDLQRAKLDAHNLRNRATRAEAAVEAMRKVVDAEQLAFNPGPAWAAARQAFDAYYDANKPEPTDEHRCRYRADYVCMDAVFDKVSEALTAAGAPPGTTLGRVRWAIRERDAALKRVEELEDKLQREQCANVELERRAERAEEEARELDGVRQAMYLEEQRATRAETAVEAMRPVWEAASEWARSTPGYNDHDFRLKEAVQTMRSTPALADYDANKPEPTDEQPQARGGGKCEACNGAGTIDVVTHGTRCNVCNGTGRAPEPPRLPLRPETRDALVERLNRATCTASTSITVPVDALSEVVRVSDPTRQPEPASGWPRAQKQGWGLEAYTGDPPPIPTYGPGSRFAEAPRHTGEPPSGDTPEAIARDALCVRSLRLTADPQDTDEMRIIARIRALVVGELRAVVEQARRRELEACEHDDDVLSVGVWEVAEMLRGRIRALESGGGE